MFKELFFRVEVVAPHAYAFSRGWLVRLYDGLVVEFVEPLVNVFLNILCVWVVFWVKDFEARVRIGHDFLEKPALLDFAGFDSVVLFRADGWYTRSFFEEVTNSVDYGFFGTYHGEVNFVFVCFCELADFFDI